MVDGRIGSLVLKRAGRRVSKDRTDKEKMMTFLEHTAELLSRLRVILISVIASGFFVAFWPLDIRKLFASALNPFESPLEYTPIASVIMKHMARDLLPKGASLIAGGLLDTAYAYLMISMLVGVVLSSPIIAYELYKFFNPALYPHERRYATYIIVSFVFLFSFGIFLAYRVILPITFRILMWFVESAAALPLINLRDFINMIIYLMVGVGLLYTAPVFLVLLVDRGILSSEHLSKNRKMVYAAFIILTAVVTPDPTILSDVILLIPFLVIYEGTVIVSKRVEKNRMKREELLEQG
ncbi:MAG: twin-arginine translocase subunit TatC [Candidatus Bathyarchaeia archaeon]